MSVSAVPVAQDIKAVAGTDLRIIGTVELPTDAGDDNISGWTMEFRLSLQGIAVLTVSAAIIDDSLGTYSVDFEAADTVALAGAYEYAVMRTDTGSVTALTKGKFIFQKALPAVVGP